MLKTSQRLRFLLESPELLGSRNASLDYFKCYLAVRLFLLCFIHHCHPVFAQNANGSVPPDDIGDPFHWIKFGVGLCSGFAADLVPHPQNFGRRAGTLKPCIRLGKQRFDLVAQCWFLFAGRLQVRRTLFRLSCDHRVIDGINDSPFARVHALPPC